jgi:hypothetical protein
MLLAASLGVGIFLSEYDFESSDLSILEGHPFGTELVHPLVELKSFLSWNVFALVIFFEYRRSHIGQKEYPDGELELIDSDIVFNSKTALLCSAVFS